MANKKVTKAKLLEAIEQSAGKTTGICRILGITRPTLGRYLAEWEDAREAIDFAKMELLDLAEFSLLTAVKRGESWAVALVLKDSKSGKERGYGNMIDVTSNGESVVPKVDNERFDRAVSTLADAVRESLSGKSTDKDSNVGSTK